MTMKYFSHEKLSEHLIRIADGGGVCCYLVVGAKRACLLDTCNGVGNIREYAEALTDKPIFVILTHGHRDHIGGAALFDEVYLNPVDLPVLAQNVDMDYRVAQSNRVFHPEKPLQAADLIPSITKPTLPVRDGDVFDLGGITIRMIAAPGHTPGILCPLLVEERTIIFGDACGVAVFLFKAFSSTVTEYRESLCNLKRYESQYDRIYRNHGTFGSPKELLDNVIDVCDDILAGTDDHIPFQAPVPSVGPVYMAKAVLPGTQTRVDGKEGNILYTESKIR